AILWLSARWAGAFTPLLVIWVMSWLSWRNSFALFGLMGVIWAFLFHRSFRDQSSPNNSSATRTNGTTLQPNPLLRERGVAASRTVEGVSTENPDGPLHEPGSGQPTPDPSQERNWPAGATPLLGGAVGGFKVPMHVQKRKSALHVPWRRLLASRTVWLLWVQYFCLTYGWYFYVTWLPTYLKETRGLQLDQ